MIALTYFVLRPKRGESLDKTEYVLVMSSCVSRLLGRPCHRKLWNGLRGTGPFLRLETLWEASLRNNMLFCPLSDVCVL